MWIAAATRGVTPIRGSGAGGCQAAVAVLGIAALACDRRRRAPSPPGSYWMRLGCSPRPPQRSAAPAASAVARALGPLVPEAGCR